ncbi:MAG: hypothetical protein R8K49_08845 [Mariprofundaceae bacterium]
MQEKELKEWLIKHASLLSMCEAGGWPDFEHMNIETCLRNNREWIIIVDFNEQLREIAVCEPVIHNRCGQFCISLDDSGAPIDIRMISRM